MTQLMPIPQENYRISHEVVKLYAFSIILLLRSKMLADTKMVGSSVKLVEIQGDE
jgi:hypothetical protein